ncbi:MAG TPA: hypothetical protein VNA57_06450 [Acidimicrobiales bacterium]|nr:hypothetical protein [Acidimicrobiales bacterium]
MTEPVTPGAAPPNRLPLILGAGVGAIALIFVATQVLGGDDDSDDAAPLPTPTPEATVPAPVTPTTVAPSGSLPETFEVFSTKNPFVPLRAAATGGTGGATGGSTATGGGTTAGTGGTATGGTTTGGTTTGTGGTTSGGTTSGGGTEPRRGSRVALMDVFTEAGGTVANVRVNDTVYKVSEGEVFATSFKVVSLSLGDRCGRFVFGDDSFRLCRNEETLK